MDNDYIPFLALSTARLSLSLSSLTILCNLFLVTCCRNSRNKRKRSIKRVHVCAIQSLTQQAGATVAHTHMCASAELIETPAARVAESSRLVVTQTWQSKDMIPTFLLRSIPHVDVEGKRESLALQIRLFFQRYGSCCRRRHSGSFSKEAAAAPATTSLRRVKCKQTHTPQRQPVKCVDSLMKNTRGGNSTNTQRERERRVHVFSPVFK